MEPKVNFPEELTEKNGNKNGRGNRKSILKKEIGIEKQHKKSVKIAKPSNGEIGTINEGDDEEPINKKEMDEEEVRIEVVEKRKKRKVFKTVKEPSDFRIDKYGFTKKEEDEKKEGKDSEVGNSGIKFKRSSKRSTTLMENSSLSKKLFDAEMSVPVLQETLVVQQKGNPSEKYKMIKILGTGSFGQVYKAKSQMFNNTVAMKVIEKDPNNELDEEEVRNEINILKKLSHPNIVKIYEFYNSNSHYYIITEYCREGELFNYIKNKYSERQLAILFYQVFSGLWYLHENKIIHRDIKLENIMISQKEKDLNTDEEYFWIKIIDFGTAKLFEKSKKEKDIVGSSYYIAPEVLRQNYDEKCDIWSIGVILYMTLVGRAPFDGEDDEEIIEKIISKSYNEKEPKLMEHSPEVRDLVKKLLEKDKHKRLSAKEALQHEWFEKFGGRTLFSNYKKDEIKPFIKNLLEFSFHSKIQQLVIAFLVHNLPQTESVKTILKMFRHFNKTGSCKLTKQELKEGLYEYKGKEEVDKAVEHLFILLDSDNNGFIEFEEFLRACVDKKQLLTDEKLKLAFKFLDREGSKTLNVQKIISVLLAKPNKILEAAFNTTLKSVDHDSDGNIDFQEFKELMLKTMN